MTDGDSRLLLAYVLGKDRAWFVAHGDEVRLTPEQQRIYDAALERRARGEPLAYIMGETWFYGRRFAVTADVLVPRPETEHLVDEALAFLRTFAQVNRGRRPVVLDVGTGSGAIACTIAAEFPDAVVYATERSSAALDVARRNGGESGVHFALADLLPANASLRFDCAIANLPYVPSPDVPRKPDPVGFEPRDATDGGPDGLREYRRLMAVLPARMNAGGLVLLEAAPPTIAPLRDLVCAAFETSPVEIGFDYAGLERWAAVHVKA